MVGMVAWLMSSGIMLPNILGMIIVHERGLPFLTNQDKRFHDRGIYFTLFKRRFSQAQ
jgi:hypothetical protein